MADIASLITRPRPLFIDGDWHAGDGGPIEVVDPARGAPFATVAAASAAQVARAAEAAERAFPAWRRTTGTERAGSLRAIAAGLRTRRQALVELQMLNNGKPRAEAEIDLADAAACFDHYADLAEGLDARPAAFALAEPTLRGARRAEPIGPVGLIVPWNFPLVTSAWKLAPALAAGCTAVLKVSEVTPLAELAYGDIAESIDLPPGVLNILTGSAEAGIAMTREPRFRKLSFTGSNAVGAKVMAAAAERCVPVSLELGGKSPIVVFADADFDQALDLVSAGIFMNCGQMCSATSRLVLDQSLSAAFLEALAVRARSLRIGAPVEGEIDIGPLTTRPQFDKVRGFLGRAEQDGIRCIAGGRLERSGAGFFAPPTVYADVPTGHFLWREELFGPILSVRTFGSEPEAIALANDSDFGLAATVVSSDEDRAIQVAERLEAGHIWLNAPQIILPETSWGGFRASGIGRELGVIGLQSYQQQKFLTIMAR